MKRVRFRTTMIALVVLSVSATSGIGLGRMLAKVAFAGDKRKSASKRASRIRMNGPVVQNNNGGGGRVAPLGLRRLPDYPLNLRRKPALPGVFTPDAVSPLPMWTYNVTASSDLGGGSYSGQIIGLSPFNRLKTTFTIPVQIVPLIITINDGTSTVTYDPTIDDPCVPTGEFTGIDVVTGSPVFQNNNWTMNGVFVGNTQYHDANQRAQFWSLVGGTNYHLRLSQTVLAAQKINVTVGNSSGPIENINLTPDGFCGYLGIMQIQDLDNAVYNIMTGPLAAQINVGTLPIFVMKSVVMADGSLDNCCILGYHDAFNVGANIQVYSPFCLDTTGVFGEAYTTDLAHEIGEAINDPTGVNPTPVWGNIGQDYPDQCQNNFEVGDPLSPGFGTVTNTWSVVETNGLTYGLQELAFFSWFYGGPSLGAGGYYSNNGSFKGDNIPCPPGGTNE
jgi:hypothetical protein